MDPMTMTENPTAEWIESMRRRTQDLSKTIQAHEARLLLLEERGRAAQERLDRVGTRIDRIDDQVRKAEHDLVSLKIKAGAWGLLGGLLPAVGALILAMK